jgi:hypothetical protein
LWAREPEQIRNTEFRFLCRGEDGLMVTKDDSVFLEGGEVWSKVRNMIEHQNRKGTTKTEERGQLKKL